MSVSFIKIYKIQISDDWIKHSFALNRYILFTPFQLHNNPQSISYQNLKTTCSLLLAFVS